MAKRRVTRSARHGRDARQLTRRPPLREIEQRLRNGGASPKNRMKMSDVVTARAAILKRCNRFQRVLRKSGGLVFGGVCQYTTARASHICVYRIARFSRFTGPPWARRRRPDYRTPTRRCPASTRDRSGTRQCWPWGTPAPARSVR